MSRRIMIVEDSRLIYREMAEFLKDSDFEIAEWCQDGERALEAYSEVRPDLVTMDIILPGMDGMDAAAQLLVRWPEARVVMVSALSSGEDASAAKEMGVRGFLDKPFTQTELLDCIRGALAD